MKTADNLFPPHGADRFLRMLLGPDNADSISGDLLEEYRETVYPARGRSGANAWFVGEVARFTWHIVGVWAVMFASLQLGRDALDWFLPPSDYALRSAITTYLAAGIFLALGSWRGWRSRSLVSTMLAASVAATVAAILKVAGVLLIVSIWPAAQTDLSGGFDEAIFLPWMMVLPATIIATISGVLGKAARLQALTRVGGRS